VLLSCPINNFKSAFSIEFLEFNLINNCPICVCSLELCQSLASTTFGGVAGPSASTSSAGASSSQSRPPGCG
jgi:hypothetical protein